MALEVAEKRPGDEVDPIQGLGTLHPPSHGFFRKEGKTLWNDGYLENHTLSCSTNLYNCNYRNRRV